MIELVTLGVVDVKDGDGRALEPLHAQPKRLALLIPASAVLAAILSFVSYYVQYVMVTLRSVRTLSTTTAENRGYTNGGLLGAPP